MGKEGLNEVPPLRRYQRGIWRRVYSLGDILFNSCNALFARLLVQFPRLRLSLSFVAIAVKDIPNIKGV